MDYAWYDFVGNVGVAMMLVAFFLLQSDRLGSKDMRYLLLNSVGAALLLFSLYFAFNLSAVVMEGVWLLTSIYGIVRVLRARRRA